MKNVIVSFLALFLLNILFNFVQRLCRFVLNKPSKHRERLSERSTERVRLPALVLQVKNIFVKNTRLLIAMSKEESDLCRSILLTFKGIYLRIASALVNALNQWNGLNAVKHGLQHYPAMQCWSVEPCNVELKVRIISTACFY